MSRSTAVLLVGYNRPELILKSIERLANLGDLRIIVSIDGQKIPNSNLADNWRSISNLYSRLTWKLRNTNLGLATHIVTAITEVLNEYDNCIVLEDDVQVEVSPLLEMGELLNSRLPNSVLTVGLFGGLPSLPFLSSILKNRWRSTRYFSAWGWGIQREDWKNFDLNIASRYESELDSLIIKYLGKSRLATWKRRFKIVAENPKFTWDYQLFLYSLVFNKKHILPTFRTCENVGFDDSRASNTRDGLPSWYKGSSSRSISHKKARGDKTLITAILQIVDSLTWAGDQPQIQKTREFRRKFLNKKSA